VGPHLVKASALPNPEISPYLVRVQHAAPGNTICVLLRHDGQFHLEASHGDRTKVSEGSLPSAELLKVQRMAGWRRPPTALPRLARVAEDDPCVRDTADQHLPHRPLAESSLHG
jgi:hypothetical protein